MHDSPSAVALRILGTREDISGLTAINTSILKNGAAVYITSAQALFLLDKESTETPDGTAVIAPVSGRGRWERQGLGLDIIRQHEWSIDFENGDDHAPGTPQQPLKTGAEFTRRTYGKGLGPDPITVSIVGSCPNPSADYIVLNSPVLSNDSFLTIRASDTIQLASFTVTVVNNQVPSVSQTTIQSSTDLSGFVGKRIRKIDGPSSAPVGTICYVEYVAVDGTATLSSPCFVDTNGADRWWATQTIQQLAVEDQFVVEEMHQLCSLAPRLFGLSNLGNLAGGVVDLAIGNSSLFEDMTVQGFQMYGCQVNLGSVLWDGPYQGVTNVTACRFSNVYNAMNVEGIPNLISNSFATAIGTQSPVSSPRWYMGNSIRGFFYQVGRAGMVEINNSGPNSGLCVHEWPVTSNIGAALHVQEGCTVNLDGILWGTSTQPNTYGIRVDATGRCVYNQIRKPVIAGALAPTKDVEVGGVALAYANVPNYNATNGAALVRKN